MRLGLLLVLAGCPKPPSAVQPDPTLHCLPSPEALNIDGRQDDPVWRDAPPTALQSHQGHAPGHAHCAYDALGVAVLVVVPDTHLMGAVTERDGRTWDDDVIEWFVRPATEGYVETQVNVLGTRFDKGFGGALDPNVRAGIALLGDVGPGEDTAWQAELYLTWTELGVTGPGAHWTGHVARYDHSPQGLPALGSTAPFTELSFHRTHEWPAMVFHP